jgi:hypothetical protein
VASANPFGEVGRRSAYPIFRIVSVGAGVVRSTLALMGIVAMISVPFSSDCISNRPPCSLTRSFMPVRPTPPCVPLAEKAARVCFGIPRP